MITFSAAQQSVAPVFSMFELDSKRLGSLSKDDLKAQGQKVKKCPVSKVHTFRVSAVTCSSWIVENAPFRECPVSSPAFACAQWKPSVNTVAR
jgi:hypothetical protein